MIRSFALFLPKMTLLHRSFIPRCSPRARKFPSSGQLFCTTYGCGATGRWPSQNDTDFSMW